MIPTSPTGQAPILHIFLPQPGTFSLHPFLPLVSRQSFNLGKSIHCNQLWILAQPKVLFSSESRPGFQTVTAEEGEGPQWVNVTKLIKTSWKLGLPRKLSLATYRVSKRDPFYVLNKWGKRGGRGRRTRKRITKINETITILTAYSNFQLNESLFWISLSLLKSHRLLLAATVWLSYLTDLSLFRAGAYFRARCLTSL